MTVSEILTNFSKNSNPKHNLETTATLPLELKKGEGDYEAYTLYDKIVFAKGTVLDIFGFYGMCVDNLLDTIIVFEFQLSSIFFIYVLSAK